MASAPKHPQYSGSEYFDFPNTDLAFMPCIDCDLRILRVRALPALQFFSLSVFISCLPGEYMNTFQPCISQDDHMPVSDPGAVLPNGLHLC